MSEPILELRGLTRAFGPLEVLRGVNLQLQAGELVALVAPSGSGKSTLLHAAGLLDAPTSGEIFIAGQPAHKLPEAARTALRARTIGFVYQFHHLQAEFDAVENIMLPQLISGVGKSAARARALELLAQVGLAARASHRPGQLSGGEQQRVAIARALANRPRLLIADEPTGNLDPHTAAEVFAVLQQLARTQGLAALVATHNHDLAAQMDRTVRMQAGVLV